MNYPKRKQPRLKDYDYSSNGCYFITICTKDRKPMFWAVGAGSPRPPCLTSSPVGAGSPRPQLPSPAGAGTLIPRLSDVGKIVKHWILKINEKYPDIHLDKFVIMPNHLHLLLTIDRDYDSEDPASRIDSAMGWLKYHITVEINHLTKTPGRKIFQRSFHDHIIRDAHDYTTRWTYIDTNIERWLDDDYYIP